MKALAETALGLRLYNTLSRKKEAFRPIERGKAGLYCCGPTVYWFQHIGNLRTYVNEDVLRRFLESLGLEVRHVMNITDVGHLTSDADFGEDKMDKAAKSEKKSPEEIARFYSNAFFRDCEKLGIEKPSVIARATEHIPEIIALIRRLEQKGFTYKTSQGIFYDTSKFKGYAKLARLDLKGQKAGARKEVVRDREKKRPQDFALWFINKPGHLMQWDSPWGKGFPGWHIECSAMAIKHLGETFDIHCAGIEHIPVHSTNEIAQAEAATGKRFANFWLHNAWLMFRGEKMAKSSGKISTLSELEKRGFEPKAFRFYCLQFHYRKKMEYSEEGLGKAAKSLGRLQDFADRMAEIAKGKKAAEGGRDKAAELAEEASKKFFCALGDDLNAPIALHAVFGLMNKANCLAAKGEIGSAGAKAVLDFLKNANQVIAVLEFRERREGIPEEILRLAREREKARKEKDWKEADRIRTEINSKGYRIDDSEEGPLIKKIK